MKMLTYEDAGVNVNGVDEVLAKRFDLSKFSAVLPSQRGKMVLSCDGVGTKCKVAQMWERYDTIGIDLVAMVVNGIITTGAVPLYFLDYIGLQKFDQHILEQLLYGIQRGCEEASCQLVGGETAEMPDVYAEDPVGRLGFELVGFGVGYITQSLLSDEKIVAGDVLIGLPSSGFHSNGYSLLRKVMFELAPYCDGDWSNFFGRDLGDVLLEPTKIYVKDVLSIISKYPVKAMAHITGGGLRNIQRVLPKDLTYELSRWDVPPIFQVFQRYGCVEEQEMYNTFNMGIGMVMVTDNVTAKKIDGIKVGKIIRR